MADIMIGIILIAAVGAVIWKKRRDKKMGKSGCGGCCGSCGMKCHQRKDDGNEEAGKKLIEDFSLPIKTAGLTYREVREREKRIRERKRLDEFKKWAAETLRWYRILLCEASRNFADPHFDEAMQELTLVEYRISCLEEDPQGYYTDKKAVKKIGEIRERIARWDG